MPRVEVEVEVVPVQIQSRSQSSRQGVSQGPIGNSPVGSPTGTHPGSMQVSLSHESLQQSPSSYKQTLTLLDESQTPSPEDGY